MSSEETVTRIFEYDEYWKPFMFNEGNPDKWKEILLALNGSTWPVKSFVKSNVRVRGILHISEVSTNVLLVAPEVISKSINQRSIFRILIIDNYALVQDDEGEISKKFLFEYIAPIFDLSQDNFKEIRINAMKIRKLARNITPTRLTLLVNNQTAGVEGLEQLTLTGQDVMRGIRTLKDRQEVDLKAESIGPWIELESDDISFKMGKGIYLKNKNEKIFSILSETLK